MYALFISGDCVVHTVRIKKTSDFDMFYQKITVMLRSPSIILLLLHCTEAIIKTI